MTNLAKVQDVFFFCFFLNVPTCVKFVSRLGSMCALIPFRIISAAQGESSLTCHTMNARISPQVACFSPEFLARYSPVVSAALCQSCLASRTAASTALLYLYSKWLAAPWETGVFTSSGNLGMSRMCMIFKAEVLL